MVMQTRQQAHIAGLPVPFLVLSQRLKQALLTEFGHAFAYGNLDVNACQTHFTGNAFDYPSYYTFFCRSVEVTTARYCRHLRKMPIPRSDHALQWLPYNAGTSNTQGDRPWSIPISA